MSKKTAWTVICSGAVDIVLLSVFLFVVLAKDCVLPFALEVVLAGICLLAFLFPRGGFTVSSADLSPVRFWRRVLASKSGMLRFLTLLSVLLFVGIAYEIPVFSAVFESLFHEAAPHNVVDRAFTSGFNMNWAVVIPCYYLLATCASTLFGFWLFRDRKTVLDRQKAEERKQRFCDISMLFFNAAFLVSAAQTCFSKSGPVGWLANWFVSSGLDARLPQMQEYIVKHINIYDWGVKVLPPEVNTFLWLSSVGAFVFAVLAFWRPNILVGQILTSLAKGVVASHAAIDSVLSSWRMPFEDISIKAINSLWRNCVVTLGWLLLCYLTLFGIFGFSTGPLANAIMGWMDASVLSAGFHLPRIESTVKTNSKGEFTVKEGYSPVIAGHYINTKILETRERQNKVVFRKEDGTPVGRGTLTITMRRTVNETPELRIFLASIIALYGTAPLAVTACAFIPYAGRRRLRINDEGIVLPAKQLGLLSPFRLWSDLQTVDLQGEGKDPRKRWLKFKFFSGLNFRVRLSQLSPEGTERLLAAIDEYAQYCSISESVMQLRAELKKELQKDGASPDSEFRSLSPAAFTSTVFVPAETAEMLPASPSGETFRVVRQLSSKPLAVVYLARRSSGGLAIVKQFFLAEDTPEAQSMRRYFEREYKVLSQLSHPRIARVIDCYTEGESSFLVLDYTRGTDLRRVIRERGLQYEHVVRRWAKQLAELMVYLHSQEPAVLHRDLSPDNIVLADDGQISLIDFGAAHQFLEHITGTMIGKKCYVAPEQLRGHAAVSSDIYSFGCTLHFLLTGCDPLALSECRPSSKVTISKELDELILACTNFDSAKRPISFNQIIHILDGTESINEAPLDPSVEVDPLLEKFANPVRNDADLRRGDADLRRGDAMRRPQNDPDLSNEVPGVSISIQIAGPIAAL